MKPSERGFIISANKKKSARTGMNSNGDTDDLILLRNNRAISDCLNKHYAYKDEQTYPLSAEEVVNTYREIHKLLGTISVEHRSHERYRNIAQSAKVLKKTNCKQKAYSRAKRCNVL